MRYFTIKELCSSDTAVELGIDNTPSSAVCNELTLLVEKVLDPLRKAYGAPIHVNSGYRCFKLNKAVGGSSTSHHLFGKAADITAIHSNRAERVKLNKKIFEICKDSDLPYCQLIDERNYTWIHVSYDKYSKRHEIKHL